MARSVPMEEVGRHAAPGDAWLVIDGDVYDVSKFARLHPGGEAVLKSHLGTDASEAFWGLHRVEHLRRYGRLRIGRVAGAEGPSPVEANDPAALSAVPYAEPSFLQGFKSPYWKESHRRLRAAVARFREAELRPHSDRSEDSGAVPTADVFRKMGAAGMLAARLGPGPWMAELAGIGVSIPGDVAPAEFDYFHELLCHQEVMRLGTPSYCAGLGDGFIIGLPALLHFGSAAQKAEVVPACLRGEKKICLAISEPQAGSDVANIVTTAKKTRDGKHFVVNGAKKWITNGAFSDYFVTAVRTGGKGMFGISMLLIERGEGVKTTPIPTAYSSCAGTAYVEFKDCKVPVGNLIGRQNQGFRCIMHNFNHERWMIIAQVLSAARLMVEESFKWANQRKVFGKRLIEQPVIRHKLARMVGAVESSWHWLEHLTYQLGNMPFEQAMKQLAGPFALLKYQATRSANLIADESAQVFGGRAITRTGMGRRVEALFRAVKYGAILGGSEEIMADLGIRQAVKDLPATTRL